MFKYFPTNYVWNLSVDFAIEMGARIGEIEAMCAPLQEAAKQPDAAGTKAFRETWSNMAGRLCELAAEDESRGRMISAGDFDLPPAPLTRADGAATSRKAWATRHCCIKIRTSAHFGVESLALLANRVSIFVRRSRNRGVPCERHGSGQGLRAHISPEGFFAT